ncbi:uncharacterized protein CDAR_543611 [Caerostris darwini]|uniref:Reverse transcriptase domain-containing protein n=1 Tax=Caerostris darwini TaxID=1538125 RepID=A0AAV4V1T1_9ARAC|nr:uncharacterized protein CDAR_543611 [Caerostris darwini]
MPQQTPKHSSRKIWILQKLISGSKEYLTLKTRRGDSWIDLIITKHLNNETTLQTLDEVTDSDDNLLHFHCTNNIPGSTQYSKIRINEKNWFSVKTSIHKIISKNLDFTQLPAGELNSYIKLIQDSIFQFPFQWADGQRTPSSCNQPSNSLTYTALTCKEVESAIMQIKPRKAVGIGGLPGEIIKEIFLANKVWFTDLMNHLLKNGLYPAAWKIAMIILLDKENKSLDHPSHFRPICVLPCWGKILDKIITNRLSFHMESNHLISENLFGFRKNKSTIPKTHLPLEDTLIFTDGSKMDNKVQLTGVVFALSIVVSFYFSRFAHFLFIMSCETSDDELFEVEVEVEEPCEELPQANNEHCSNRVSQELLTPFSHLTVLTLADPRTTARTKRN